MVSFLILELKTFRCDFVLQKCENRTARPGFQESPENFRSAKIDSESSMLAATYHILKLLRRNLGIARLELPDPESYSSQIRNRRISATKSGGPGTEPEPEGGTVGTVFPGIERGTGTVLSVKLYCTETHKNSPR